MTVSWPVVLSEYTTSTSASRESEEPSLAHHLVYLTFLFFTTGFFLSCLQPGNKWSSFLTNLLRLFFLDEVLLRYLQSTIHV